MHKRQKIESCSNWFSPCWSHFNCGSQNTIKFKKKLMLPLLVKGVGWTCSLEVLSNPCSSMILWIHITYYWNSRKVVDFWVKVHLNSMNFECSHASLKTSITSVSQKDMYFLYRQRYRFRRTKNCRIVEIIRPLWGQCSASPLLKAGLPGTSCYV